jgi:hypothetical protein
VQTDGGYPVKPGRSIEQMIWGRCLEEYTYHAEHYDEAIKAKADAFAEAVAIIRNPYSPDIAQVRREIKQRYKDDHAD